MRWNLEFISVKKTREAFKIGETVNRSWRWKCEKKSLVKLDLAELKYYCMKNEVGNVA